MLDIIFSQLVPLDSAQGVSLPMQKKDPKRSRTPGLLALKS